MMSEPVVTPAIAVNIAPAVLPEITLPSTASIPGQKFGDMNMTGKVVFCLKFCCFLASFGFAFPTLLND
jgi:hypothetical protein